MTLMLPILTRGGVMRTDVEPVVLQTWSALYQNEMLKFVHSA